MTRLTNAHHRKYDIGNGFKIVIDDNRRGLIIEHAKRNIDDVSAK